ncbi:MAG: HD domain-containing response regulator [Gammaproteobacteria bacterium]
MTNSSSVISKRVLFVDDEKWLLEGIKRQLRREIELSLAETAEAALALLEKQGPYAVVVSDYNMPHTNGLDFLNTVYRRFPQTVLIMLTGRAELDLAIDALHSAHLFRFLSKPCSKELLLETVNDALEQYRLRMSESLLKTQLQQANQELNRFNQQLETLIAQKTRALQIQYQHVAKMAQMESSQAVIAMLVETAIELAPKQTLTLWLSPQANGQFKRYYPRDLNPMSINCDQTQSGLINELGNGLRLWQDQAGPEQMLSAADASLFVDRPRFSVPLQSKNGLIGLLNFGGPALDYPVDTLDTLAGIANVSATALQSHWHREAFEDAQDAIINALAKLSEYRDPDTGAHLRRLKKYCALTCDALASNERYRAIVTTEFKLDLMRSSPLHDIGKVGIPDAILKKPGNLTTEEFEIMKNHAKIGGDLLAAVYREYPSQSFIKSGMEVAYYHHEKWDGSGYPLGLKGQEIPLSARILALADVYDALTCRRIYKVPFSHERAKLMILTGSGTHFDPDIVAAFLKSEDRFRFFAEQFADSSV